MLDIETILSFSVASIALCLAPGPDNLFVLSQSAAHGRSAGLGDGRPVHRIAFSRPLWRWDWQLFSKRRQLPSPSLRIAGVAYLLFLAWKAFTARAKELGAPDTPSNGGFYRRGVIMNVTNPKVSIFFLGFSAPVRESREWIRDDADHNPRIDVYRGHDRGLWSDRIHGRRVEGFSSAIAEGSIDHEQS